MPAHSMQATGLFKSARPLPGVSCHQRKPRRLTGIAAAQVVTEFGRPSWPNILARIADTHPGKTVGIFTCGPTKLCRSVKRSAQEWNARTDQRIKVPPPFSLPSYSSRIRPVELRPCSDPRIGQGSGGGATETAAVSRGRGSSLIHRWHLHKHLPRWKSAAPRCSLLPREQHSGAEFT